MNEQPNAENDVAYDNCPPAASHTCDECKRVVPRCPYCGDAIGHALRPCPVCNPGRVIPPAACPRGHDRTAGRWCAACGQHGSHHTDRHEDFTCCIPPAVGVSDGPERES